MLTRTEMNRRYRLYDNLGASLDRYTLVDMKNYRTNVYQSGKRLYDCLSFSKNIESYCQHDSCQLWKHLGKRLDPFDFPRIQYIISEIF